LLRSQGAESCIRFLGDLRIRCRHRVNCEILHGSVSTGKLTRRSYNASYPEYLGATYDASMTNLTYRIPPPDSHTEPASIVLSFLSPITPTSTFRQSLPAAYLSVTVEGTFNISVYVDLNGQWVSGDRQSPIVWSYIESQKSASSVGLKTWRVTKKNEALFTQLGDRAEWGTLYFSASDVRTLPLGPARSNILGR
jgi:hypothetical protein